MITHTLSLPDTRRQPYKVEDAKSSIAQSSIASEPCYLKEGRVEVKPYEARARNLYTRNPVTIIKRLAHRVAEAFPGGESRTQQRVLRELHKSLDEMVDWLEAVANGKSSPNDRTKIEKFVTKLNHYTNVEKRVEERAFIHKAIHARLEHLSGKQKQAYLDALSSLRNFDFETYENNVLRQTTIEIYRSLTTTGNLPESVSRDLKADADIRYLKPVILYIERTIRDGVIGRTRDNRKVLANLYRLLQRIETYERRIGDIDGKLPLNGGQTSSRITEGLPEDEQLIRQTADNRAAFGYFDYINSEAERADYLNIIVGFVRRNSNTISAVRTSWEAAITIGFNSQIDLSKLNSDPAKAIEELKSISKEAKHLISVLEGSPSAVDVVNDLKSLLTPCEKKIIELRVKQRLEDIILRSTKNNQLDVNSEYSSTVLGFARYHLNKLKFKANGTQTPTAATLHDTHEVSSKEKATNAVKDILEQNATAFEIGDSALHPTGSGEVDVIVFKAIAYLDKNSQDDFLSKLSVRNLQLLQNVREPLDAKEHEVLDKEKLGRLAEKIVTILSKREKEFARVTDEFLKLSLVDAPAEAQLLSTYSLYLDFIDALSLSETDRKSISHFEQFIKSHNSSFWDLKRFNKLGAVAAIFPIIGSNEASSSAIEVFNKEKDARFIESNESFATHLATHLAPLSYGNIAALVDVGWLQEKELELLTKYTQLGKDYDFSTLAHFRLDLIRNYLRNLDLETWEAVYEEAASNKIDYLNTLLELLVTQSVLDPKLQIRLGQGVSNIGDVATWVGLIVSGLIDIQYERDSGIIEQTTIKRVIHEEQLISDVENIPEGIKQIFSRVFGVVFDIEMDQEQYRIVFRSV